MKERTPKHTAAVSTLEHLGYTYCGGEQWKPPLGQAPDFGLVNAQSARIAELEAQIEALSGVQALSAAPAEQEEAAQRLRKTLDIDPGDVNDPLHPRYIAGFKSGHAAGRRRAAPAASLTLPAEQQAAQVIIDFSQVGTAGPFPVVNGRVSLPDATMQDLARMLRPTYEAEQQPATEVALVGAYARLPDFDSGDEPIWEAVFKWANATRGSDASKKAMAVESTIIDSLRDFADRTHALRMEQAAPKAAPGVGNSGFDHKTAADLLNNKTVSDEAVRKFVATSRWAHDERAALSATLLAMHGVLTSREAEIALLKKALMEAEAAPQPAPAPLSAREIELLDGMIDAQLNHAQRCGSIPNRPMAEKQKGWDMERVTLLRKLKTAMGGQQP